jgi:hypothetical protein
MGFANTQALVNACNDGQKTIYSWRKTPAAVTFANVWLDYSMIAGNPVPQYYAAAPLEASTIGTSGFYVGKSVSPSTKYLFEFQAMCSAANGVPTPFVICDYLLYYPFVDQAEAAQQDMTNSTTLPRYTDGLGVQMMAVLVAPQTGSSTFFVGYTNSDGTSGRVTPTMTCNTATVNGSLVTTSSATVGCTTPFIPLQAGDKGVRQIDYVTFLTNDVGLITLVLVYPLANFQLRNIDAPTEVCFFKETSRLPVIQDGAYLSMLGMTVTSLASVPFSGTITSIWG